MGKSAGRVMMALLAAAWGPAQIQHEVAVVNISVPVRVFDGAKFVDSLAIGDFEVSEDGRAQPIEAVYLVRGGAVKKREGATGAPPPETHRNFVLLFQIAEYMPEIDKAVDLFFESVCRPGDAVDIVTPQRVLRLRNRIDSPEKVKKAQYEIKGKLRTDILVLSGAYRSIIDDMLAHLGAGDPEYARVDLESYRTDLQRLEAMRWIDPERMTAFAADLKGRPGSKHVFLFYQREKVPQFSNQRLVEALNSNDPEAAMKIMELMSAYNHDSEIDHEAIQRAFSDASTDVHFLYVTRNRRDPQLDVENMGVLDGIQMAESSAAIYRVFREIAAATGGTSAASANPAALLRQAAAASEDYYLVYYRPQDYRADGKFHKIGVTVKRTGLRVSHREGYFAEDAAAAAARAVTGPPATGGQAAAEKAATKAEAGLGVVVEDIDLAEPLPVKGDPVPESVLKAAAGYCLRLSEASLDFVCREDVQERLSGALSSTQAEILKDTSPEGRGVVVRSNQDWVRDWVYDYQLVRKEGWAAETRILLEQSGKSRHEENAALRTVRFRHKFVVLGPVGLFSDDVQSRHDYRVAQEKEIEGEPVLVIDVRPRGLAASSLYGQAWVRPRDGAVLKIEWEPASMGNYADIEEFAKAIRAKPRIKFTSAYAVEKNGLRFPSSYEVTEAYRTTRGNFIASRTSVAYKDYKFFEVKVRTEVRRGG
jgi:VWFA-related protein